MIVVLNSREFRGLVSMEDAIDAVREAFVAAANGQADQPQRIVSRDHRALSMLARLEPSLDTVVKVATVSPDNGRVGLPTIHAVVLLFDGRTGAPKVLIDGEAVTALRTGAASGVATELLAPRDARVLATIGSGGQAADQIDAVCAVRDIREIRITSRNAETCKTLAARVRASRPTLRVKSVASTSDAVRNADIICCATTATEPLFALDDLTSNVHVNAIGAYTPSMCEISSEVLAHARVVAIDQLEAALQEAGDVIQAIASGGLSVDSLRELGSLLSGNVEADGGLTVFKSVGIAVQDWAVARLARERAAQLADVKSVDFVEAS